MQSRRLLIIALVAGLAPVAAFLVLGQAGLAQPAVPEAVAVVGSPFPIATTANDEQSPAVAYDEGRDRYLVVYENASGQNAVCVDPDGTIVRTYVAGTGQNPDVVYSADHDQYLVVYDYSGNVEGQFVSGSCCMQVGCIGMPFPISGDRPNSEYGPAVAYNNHANHQDYLVVWTDTDEADYGIYARQVFSLAGFGGSSFPVTYTTSAWNYEPDVAYNLNRNEYLVAYTHDSTKGGSLDAPDIYGTLVKNTGGVGVLTHSSIDASARKQDNATVAAYRLNYETPYLVIYTDYFWDATAGDVTGYLVYTTGMPFNPVNVAKTSGVQEMLPSLASNESSGGYVAVWMAHNGTDFDTYWRRVDNDGTLHAVGPLAAVNGKDERYPVVAGGDPTALGVWQEENADWDIYARILRFLAHLPLVLRDA